MSSRESAVRAAILDVIDCLDSPGQTHDYMRWAVKKQDVDSLFQTTIGGTAQIRAWEVTWVSASQEQSHMRRDARGVERTYEFRIHGWMGLDDSAATEKTFAGLVEDLIDLLDADATLHAYFRNHPAQLLVFDHRLFATRLCHHAEIAKAITERVDQGSVTGCTAVSSGGTLAVTITSDARTTVVLSGDVTGFGIVDTSKEFRFTSYPGSGTVKATAPDGTTASDTW